MEEVVQPDDIKILDPGFVPGVGKLRRAAALNADQGHLFAQPPGVLQDRFEILIADHGHGNIVGVGHGGVVQDGGGQGNIHAFFFRLERVAGVAINPAQAPTAKVDREGLQLVVVLFFEPKEEIEPPLDDLVVLRVIVGGIAAEQVGADDVDVELVQLTPELFGQDLG